KDLLIARSRRAAAERQIHDTMARVDTTGVTGGFERMEDKVRTQEARAKATAELDHDSVDERFKQLEQTDKLDSQLEAPKSTLGLVVVLLVHYAAPTIGDRPTASAGSGAAQATATPAGAGAGPTATAATAAPTAAPSATPQLADPPWWRVSAGGEGANMRQSP